MSVVSKETLLPLGFVIVLIGGVLWMDRRLSRIEYQLETIVARDGDRWSETDMKHWAELLEVSNPGMTIPAPRGSE